jgi:hypothetical protein
LHGYETQIELYAKAENTKNKIFLFIDNGTGSDRITAITNKKQELIERGESPAEIVIIDATPKKSASIR